MAKFSKNVMHKLDNPLMTLMKKRGIEGLEVGKVNLI